MGNAKCEGQYGSDAPISAASVSGIHDTPTLPTVHTTWLESTCHEGMGRCAISS